MEKYALPDVAASQQEISREAPSGRSSATLYGGHDRSLRQTLIALVEGQVMEVTNPPEEATLLVITGSLDVTTSEEGVEASAGDLLVVPNEPHALTARSDVAALLTVSKGNYPD